MLQYISKFTSETLSYRPFSNFLSMYNTIILPVYQLRNRLFPDRRRILYSVNASAILATAVRLPITDKIVREDSLHSHTASCRLVATPDREWRPLTSCRAWQRRSRRFVGCCVSCPIRSARDRHRVWDQYLFVRH